MADLGFAKSKFTGLAGVLESVRSLSGNEQMKALEAAKTGKHGWILGEVLRYATDAHLRFKMDGKVAGIAGRGTNKLDPNTWQDKVRPFLDYMAAKPAANQADVQKLGEICAVFTPEDAAIIVGIVVKDLRLGVAEKKVNKVFSGLVRTFSVMLAHTYRSKADEKAGKSYAEKGLPFRRTLASRKFNGKRVVLMLDEGTGKMVALSRTGHVYPHFLKVKEQMQKNFDVANFVYDGEIVHIKGGEEHFRLLGGAAAKERREDEDDASQYVIFDRIPREDFLAMREGPAFAEVAAALAKEAKVGEAVNMLHPTPYPNILVAEQVELESVEQMENLAAEAEANGYEGTMYRNGETGREYKRTRNLLKDKPFEDGEFRIVGFEGGAGKLASTLGAIVVELKVDGKSYRVNVGSGYKEEDRKWIWDNREKVLANADKYLLKVRYRIVSQDKDGNRSLENPTFLGFRDAKTKDEVFRF